MPALYAELPPSTVASRMRPSLSWPTAARALRRFRTGSPNDSRARKTGLPAGDEQRAAADRARHAAPVRGERRPDLDRRADRRLCGEVRRLVAARHEHRAARRNRDRAVVEHLRDGAGDHAVRRQRRQRRRARRSTTPLSDGVAGPHDERVERRVALHGRRVEVELPPLAVAVPRAVEADARDGERAVGGDAETRARARRSGLEHAAAHEDARGLPGIRREEVAVDADDGRASRRRPSPCR